MKSITERVHQRFIFLVNQGCGEWGITTHESLGQILYKYTNTVDDIHLDICENVLPKPLNKYTDNETWKGITILFNLRNIIVHGKIINAKLIFKDNKNQLEYAATFEKVLNYFKERKVLKQHHFNSDTHKILSIQATKHFIKITDKFVDEIFWKIQEEQKLDEMLYQNAYKMNILKAHGIDLETLPKRKKLKTENDDLPF